MLTKAPRGTKDILDVPKWTFLESHLRKISKLYGYREIRTPMFEHTELFKRGIGQDTDVVDKEMYTFTDRGDRSITLRPENTAAVVRAYLENKLYAQSSLTKLFYIGSMFRYDRPQAGRMREFHQFGIEAIGEEAPAVDAEIITLALRSLEGLGLHDLELSLNSVGCPICRKDYRERLQEYFKDYLTDLCKDCQSRYTRSPMRILDCKVDAHKEYMQAAPKITDCLCNECKEHFAQLQELLTSLGISYTLDSRLVRGLDYYTKTAFEIKYPPLGAQSAVAGGGRYDGLISEIGGDTTPAVGFAMGLERVLLALEQQNLIPDFQEKADVYLVSLGEKAFGHNFKLLEELRQKGVKAEMAYTAKSMKAQLKQADKLGAELTLILGDDELAKGEITVRNMVKGEQSSIALSDVVEFIMKENS